MPPYTIRQGDVLLIKRNELPKDAKPVAEENGRIILLRGEVTGHHHSFAVADGVKGFQVGEKLWVEVPKAAPLEHQEHDTIPVPEGIYEMAEQVEDDGLEDARAVAD